MGSWLLSHYHYRNNREADVRKSEDSMQAAMSKYRRERKKQEERGEMKMKGPNLPA